MQGRGERNLKTADWELFYARGIIVLTARKSISDEKKGTRTTKN